MSSRLVLRDYHKQVIAARARVAAAELGEHLAGCVVVAICAAVFVVLLVRAGA